MMRPLSITFRLTLFFALASTAVLVAVGYLVASAVERHFVDLDRAELDGKLQLVRHLLARAGSPADLAAVTQALDDALVGHPGLSIIIVDRNDRVVFASSDTTLRPAVLQRSLDAGRPERLKPSVLESDGHAFRDIVGSAHTGMADHPPLAVAIAVNIDHQRGFLLALREKLWIAIASGVVLMTVLGWIAARRGLAPVRAMAALAQRISATHLDARLPPGSVPAELQGLAQAFDEMLERLAGSFRQLTDFSSDLAHEMRTPISNLVTQTEVALSRTRSPDEYREVLYSSLEEYERLTRMISDMLFLAKADDGTTVLHTEPVDLAAETNALFEFFAALADERDVTLVLEGGGRIEAERLMLRRAISNLLSNAIRHTPTGGEVRVEIRPLASGQVRFTVANPGEIPAEHLPRLFDRFYRVDASRHRTSEGAGLGLAITKSIVATHKGSIRVSSGGGMTRFEILWPGARAAAAGSAGRPGAKPSAGAADELARGGPPVLTQK